MNILHPTDKNLVKLSLPIFQGTFFRNLEAHHLKIIASQDEQGNLLLHKFLEVYISGKSWYIRVSLPATVQTNFALVIVYINQSELFTFLHRAKKVNVQFSLHQIIDLEEAFLDDFDKSYMI